jgi:alpha-L-fucosidase
VTVLVRQLVEVASRGGNYLLNVGPTAEGVIPQPSVDRLREVGRWMKVNGEAIYGTQASPFPYDASWGTVTSKPGKLYLHVFDWPKGELVVYGLRNKINKATLLAGRQSLKVSQQSDKALDHDMARIVLPAKAPTSIDSVIVLDIEGAPRVDPSLIQQPSGIVELKAMQGKVETTAREATMKMDARGVAEHWTSEADSLKWTFKVVEPGAFDVLLVSSEKKYGDAWDGGHKVVVDIDGNKLPGTVEAHEKRVPPHNPYWPYAVTRIGRVTLDKAGPHTAALKADKIVKDKNLGLTLVSLELVPAKK